MPISYSFTTVHLTLQLHIHLQNCSWAESYIRDCLYEAQTNVIMAQGRLKDYHDLHAKYQEFYPGDAVCVKDLRRDKTWWPGTVVECSTPNHM